MTATNERPQCALEDLRAIILIESSWGVDANGVVDIEDHYGEGGGDTGYIDYYRCDNCDMTFEPENDATWPRNTAAWKSALDHLKVKEAA